MLRAWLAIGLVAVAVMPAGAQNAAPPAPCTSPEYRQFDFWVGDWVSENPATHVAQGTNVITREFGGCVVVEHWAGSAGMHGTSFNIYDASRHVWHQTWVDDRGALLVLEGHFADGKMMLQSAPVAGPAGRVQVNRITWTPLEGGRVSQLWEVSADGGTTWQISFLGIYRPRS